MEKELYHIHVKEKNNKDYKWDVGRIITVDDNFDSIMNKRQQSFNQCIQIVDENSCEQVQFYQYLAELYNCIKDRTIIKGEELEELKDVIKNGYNLSYNANFFKRESGLEDCRKNNFSNLPSRLHSVYLCDDDGLEYWIDNISFNRSKEINIFKVLADGNIFKTNEQLLPTEESTYGQTYQAAFKYWNPKFKDFPNYTNEYLVQGKIKVLEQLNKF